MSVAAQLPPELGGASGKVITFLRRNRKCSCHQVAYIDTEGKGTMSYTFPRFNFMHSMHRDVPPGSYQINRRTIRRGWEYGTREYSLRSVLLNVHKAYIFISASARAFNSEHQVVSRALSIFRYLTEKQMELINECSIRFAEDKDFRLLVMILR